MAYNDADSASTIDASTANNPQARGQEALYHGAGRFRELLIFEPAPEADRATVTWKAAELLKFIEFNFKPPEANPDKSPESNVGILSPQILVALGTSYLGPLKRKDFAAEAVGSFDAENPAVLVQIAAETEDDRTYARRVVKRIFGGQLRLRNQYSGGLHLLSKEPFGFPEATPKGKIEVPLSEAHNAESATWLLHQHYIQDVERFSALPLADQENIMGRPKRPATPDTMEEYAKRENSHTRVARDGAARGKTALLRRSMSYERYDEAGLNFIATAKHPQLLKAALDRFNAQDRLREYVRPQEGGLFFVPPKSSWLGVEVEVPSPLASAPEKSFYPDFPLVLYDLTPKASAFLKKVFHANPDNIDELEPADPANPQRKTLRSDVKLLTQGLTKLIFGRRIERDSQLHRLLDLLLNSDVTRAFDAKTVSSWAPQVNELRQANKDYKKALLERPPRKGKPDSDDPRGALVRKRKALHAKFSAHPAVAKVLKGKELPNTLAPLLADALVADAETPTELSEEAKREIDEITQLCEEAAEEARRLNKFAGEYMTFPT